MRERAVLAAALDPIITIDTLGTIQSASDSVARVLGWRPAELIGRNVSMLMPEPHRSAHDGYLANYARTGRTNILNRARRFEAMHKDGTLIPIELCVSRAEIPGGAAPLFVGIIRDMSTYAAAERSREVERVRAQQQLAEQTSALQQANLRLRMADRMASIGTLAAGLGHDMNNVLLPVRARLNALAASARSGSLPGGDRKHIEEIRKSVAYLQQLADGLHFLALDPESEADHRGDRGPTDLGRWWSQTGALLSKAVPKHVRVVASFPADLALVAAPAHGLTQAVLNLIVNAGEAIPDPHTRKRRQGLVRLSAENTEEDGERCVRLVVADNGRGMPEEVRRRAFEMFFTTKPRGLGTGLGLALVRKVADRAGGRVEIQSEVGGGTTVVMVLPSVDAAQRTDAHGGPAEATVSIRDGRARALIRLLVESAGVRVRDAGELRPAPIWITDAESTSARDARAWRREHPSGRLVLFGAPDGRATRAWGPLAPIVIEATNDFESVRKAITHALDGE